MLTEKPSKTAGVSWCEICRRYYSAAGEYIPPPAEDVVIEQQVCEVCSDEGTALFIEIFREAQRRGHGPVYTEDEVDAVIRAALSIVSMGYDLVAEDGTPLTRAERRRRQRE